MKFYTTAYNIKKTEYKRFSKAPKDKGQGSITVIADLLYLNYGM